MDTGRCTGVLSLLVIFLKQGGVSMGVCDIYLFVCLKYLIK